MHVQPVSKYTVLFNKNNKKKGKVISSLNLFRNEPTINLSN
jgi:hypothetical protein